MAIFKKLLLAFLATISLMAEFKSIDAKELLELQKNGTVVIDIRTPQEWRATGIIEGAKPIMFFTPRGEADIANFMFELGKLVGDRETPFIIYCAHANRTKTLGNWLNNLGFKKVYELDGGIEYGWIDKGYKVIPYKD
jgi:rhodanese-related sulfurtransferase